jgi:hypothetical protein
VRAALVAGTVVLLTLGAASTGETKSPPSAFGSDYEKGGRSTKVGSGDDAPLDGVSRKNERTAPRRVKAPKVGGRTKVQLDGSDGGRRDRDEDDADF